MPPSTGITTDPGIIGILGAMAFKAGAERVIVAEGSATSDLEEIPRLKEVVGRVEVETADPNKLPDEDLVDVRIPDP